MASPARPLGAAAASATPSANPTKPGWMKTISKVAFAALIVVGTYFAAHAATQALAVPYALYATLGVTGIVAAVVTVQLVRWISGAKQSTSSDQAEGGSGTGSLPRAASVHAVESATPTRAPKTEETSSSPVQSSADAPGAAAAAAATADTAGAAPADASPARTGWFGRRRPAAAAADLPRTASAHSVASTDDV